MARARIVRRRRRRYTGPVRVALLLLCACAAVAPPAPAQAVIRLELVDTAVFRARRVVESSGVTPSARRPGVLWTHNDSGDDARLYATDSAGDDLGSVLVAGARNVDWEDLAAGPCSGGVGRCFYVADIGDNWRRRDHVEVYRLREPEPPLGAADTMRTVPLEAAFRFRYPDHPHDAEAIVVDRTAGVMLITKEVLGRPRVYLAPEKQGPQGPGQVDTLRFVGLLDVEPSLARLRVVTGAAVSPDGSTLAVRTYTSLHFFRLRGDSLPAPLTPGAGLTIPFVEPQGEGVAFIAPDLLALTSEKGDAARGTMARIRVFGLSRPTPGAPPRL